MNEELIRPITANDFSAFGLSRDATRLREMALQVRAMSSGRILGSSALLAAAAALENAAENIVPMRGGGEGP